MSKGRQKVEMKKMTNVSNLQVTFSKRRSGLFKKACELTTLCNAEISIIVFSPGNKVYSFGHPSVEPIIDRFLARNSPPTSGALQLIEAHRNANVRDLNMKLTHVLDQLETEKKRGNQIVKIRRSSRDQNWWEAPLDELKRPHLEQLKHALEELKKNVANQADKLVMQNSKAPNYFAPNNANVAGPIVPGEGTNCVSFFPRNGGSFNSSLMPKSRFGPIGNGHGQLY